MVRWPMVRTFVGFDRIVADPGILGGKPCVRGTRITVHRVLEIMADTPTVEELREDYPSLQPEDIQQALAFAARALESDRVIALSSDAA